MPQISAAICTYGRHDLLVGAIDSLRAQTLGRDQFRILIIDNTGPTDAGLALQAKFDGVENIRYEIEDAPGLSRARNRAVALSQDCTFIAFLDDDAVADPSWLVRSLDCFEACGPMAGVVGGPVDPIWPRARPAWLADSLLTLLTIVDWGGERRDLAPAEWIAGTNMVFRLEALAQTGGFREQLGRTGRFVLESNEEVEVIRAVTQKGFRAIWDPALRMRHRVHEDRLDQAWIRRRISWQAVSDFKSDPEACLARLADHEAFVARFLDRMPRDLRNFSGLHAPVGDPLFFENQVAAIYGAIVLLLAGEMPRPRRANLWTTYYLGLPTRLRSGFNVTRRILSRQLGPWIRRSS